MTPSIERRKRPLLWVFAGLAGISLALVIAAVLQTVRRLPDMYAQWATADMIIAHHDKTGRFPASWSEMETFFEPQSPHAFGMAFTQIRERMVIDFARLPQLGTALSNEADLPRDLIRPRSGIRSHWSGAEPHQLVRDALSSPKPASK